MINNDKLIDK